MSFTRWKAVLTFAAATMLAVSAARAADLTQLIDAHVDFVNGGFGKEEAEALRREAASYPLELTFTRRADGSDQFIADVRLSIVDAQGRTMIEANAGPIFLAQLPDGYYTITAEYQGETKTRRVAIGGGKGQRVSLMWS